jgi:predicted nucleic acid-binding protein
VTSARAAQTAYADTNVFVALFSDENHQLHAPALQLFRRVAEGTLTLIVTPVIMAELAYVASKVLEWTRAQTTERLTTLLDADGLSVPERAVLRRALELYGAQRRLDFADAYLAAAALERGPSSIATFDSDLKAIPGLTIVDR